MALLPECSTTLSFFALLQWRRSSNDREGGDDDGDHGDHGDGSASECSDGSNGEQSYIIFVHSDRTTYAVYVPHFEQTVAATGSFMTVAVASRTL